MAGVKLEADIVKNVCEKKKKTTYYILIFMLSTFPYYECHVL